MTIDEAQQEAERRWGASGQVVESSHQRILHYTVGVRVPGESAFYPAIAGQGDSWEAAFAEADKLAHPLYVVPAAVRAADFEDALMGLVAALNGPDAMESTTKALARAERLISNTAPPEVRRRAIAERAAREICSTFDVSMPRGMSFANSTEQTIAIIIEQAVLRGGRDAKA